MSEVSLYHGERLSSFVSGHCERNAAISKSHADCSVIFRLLQRKEAIASCGLSGPRNPVVVNRWRIESRRFVGYNGHFKIGEHSCSRAMIVVSCAEAMPGSR